MTNYTSEYTGTQIDARLNNARTPTSHSNSHKLFGSDLLVMDELGLNDNENGNVTTGYHGLCPKLTGSTSVYLNGNGAWTAPASTVINVKEYGAIGNGTSDDTAAIQSAINALAGIGGTVYFPSGFYPYTSLSIPHHYVKLLGVGIGATTLAQTINGNGITIGVSDSVVSGNSISSMSIGGNGLSSGGAAVYILNTGNTIIRDVYILNSQIGIRIESTTGHWNTTIKNFTISECYNGIVIGSTGTIAQLPQDIFLSNGIICACTHDGLVIIVASGVYAHDIDIVGCDARGILIEPTVNTQTQACIFTNILTDTSEFGVLISGAGKVRFISFVNCWSASNSQTGIAISPGSGYDIRVVGTSISGNGTHGISIVGSFETNISGCGIFNNGTAINNTFDTIYIGGGSSNFSITNNIIGWTEGANKPSWGIHVDAGVGNNYIIANNRCPGNAQGILSDQGTGINKIVTPNIA